MAQEIIQTAVRLSQKQKEDIEALAAAYVTSRQAIMELAICAFIRERDADVKRGYKIMKDARQKLEG